MRKGLRDVGFIMEGDTLVGINLGWDFAAEHEMGIRGIRARLGMYDPDEKIPPAVLHRAAAAVPQFARYFSNENPMCFGLPRRIITRVPDCLQFFELTHVEKRGRARRKVKGYALIMDYFFFTDAQSTSHLPSGLHFPPPDDPNGIVTAWDNSSFGVVVREEHKDKLAEIYQAFQRLDICVFLGAAGPFSNGGLRIVIASRLPAEVPEMWYRKDESTYRLRKAVEATGIEEYLRQKGKRYYALRPRWRNEEETEFWFWLNPMDQYRYKAGWYTLEELRLWGEDKGPVVNQAVS